MLLLDPVSLLLCIATRTVTVKERVIRTRLSDTNPTAQLQTRQTRQEETATNSLAVN